jgi:tetratricopeptide (TPR) repeat protein
MTAATGRFAQAEEMLRDTLPRQERVLGRDHADTLTTAQALGVVLVGLGRPAEAVALHRDVTERRTRVLGADHDDTRISRGKLADALRSAGRWEEAAALFEVTVREAERAFGARSTQAAITRNNLASTLVQLGRLDEAAQALRDVLAVVADRPDQAALAAAVRNNLAAALFELGQYREAGSLLRESTAERERLYGPDHPDTVASVVNLARVLAADGDRTGAARLVRRGLAHYERRLRAAHPRIAELRDVLEQLG